MSERILVTGASRGLGRALVVELDRRWHDVVATARDAGSLAHLVERPDPPDFNSIG